MNIFRHPPGPQAHRILRDAGLPTADLQPGHLEDFFGCGAEKEPKGVVGLEIYGPDALLRSLAVDAGARGRGCAKALVAQAERYAASRGVRRVYLLTTTAEKFFERLGYRAVARDDAPEAIRKTAEFSSLCPSSSAFMAKTLE